MVDLKTPTVTCSLATFNQEEFIYEAVASIAAQVDEVVVVDDCSSDKTPNELLIAKRDFPNVRVIRNTQNMGVSRSFNLAIREASSRFILLSAGDDASLPSRRRLQQQRLVLEPDKFHFSPPQIIDEKSNRVSPMKAREFLDSVNNRDIYFRLLNQGNFLCATSAAFSKELFEDFGGFEEGLVQLQDWGLWLTAAKNQKIKINNEEVSKYRKHHGNLSGNNNGKTLERDLLVALETKYLLEREIEELRNLEVSQILNLDKNKIFFGQKFGNLSLLKAQQHLLRSRLAIDQIDRNVLIGFIGEPGLQKTNFQNWLEKVIDS